LAQYKNKFNIRLEQENNFKFVKLNMLPPPTAYPELTLNLLTFFYLTEKLMPDVNASYNCRN